MEEELQPLVSQEAQLSPPQPGFGAVSMLRDVAVSVILAIVMIVFVYQPVKVEGTSMMPGLTDQERIFINKYTYKLGSGKIERLDPIVFYYPYDVTQSYIKRVIGLPGDTIEIDEGTVFLNGKQIEEPYVPREYRDRRSVQKETVPQDMYFVMGDHRSSSNDSRIWGFVPRKQIYGKAVFIYWPPNKIGRVR
jgi:signal peptidase I